jgi:hypothetical protein
MSSDDAGLNLKRTSAVSGRFYVWIRDLHLYLGLSVSPYILVFAVSTLFLNHAWKPWNEDDPAVGKGRWTATIKVPDEMGSLSQAQSVVRQLELSGEIDFIVYSPEEKRIEFPLNTRGVRTKVSVDLRTGTTTVERRRTGLWDALIYLHKSPGPHNAKIRENWFYTRLWTIFSDATVYAVLFLSIGGIYLWAVLKTERKSGLIFLGIGMVVFLLISTALILNV